MLKLNLGCGFNHLDDWINVDNFAMCNPDVLLNLEHTPWSWEDSSVDEIQMIHVLEHLGLETHVYFGVIKELYRVCKPGASILIAVPHWMHENFAHDPTHVRVVTPIGLEMFSKARNQRDLDNSGGESKLGMMLDVNFIIKELTYVPDPYWAQVAILETWSHQKAERMLKSVSGVCQEIRILLEVVKP